MIYKNCALVAGVALFSASAVADTYNFALNAGHLRGDLDNTAGSTKTEAIALGVTAYFAGVDDSKGPLAEAAFLDRASGVSLIVVDSETASVNGKNYGATLSVVDKDTGFLFSVALDNGEANDLDTDTLGLSIGQYIAENTTVAVSYENATGFGADDVDSWSVDYATVVAGDLSYRIDASVGYVVDNGSQYGIGGTVYPSNDLGFGVSYDTVDLNSGGIDTWTLDAQWFINEAVSVSAFYSNVNQEGDWETDGYGVAASLRF